MGFNKRLMRQELLSKEDIELLLQALGEWSTEANTENLDSVKFLKQKLERMKK